MTKLRETAANYPVSGRRIVHAIRFHPVSGIQQNLPSGTSLFCSTGGSTKCQNNMYTKNNMYTTIAKTLHLHTGARYYQNIFVCCFKIESQHRNNTTMQQRNNVTTQNRNNATSQQCNNATSQKCNITAMQQCNIATSQQRLHYCLGLICKPFLMLVVY